MFRVNRDCPRYHRDSSPHEGEPVRYSKAPVPQTERGMGSFIILKFKHMSDVTDQYIVGARHKAEEQSPLSYQPSVRLYNPRGGRFDR